MSYPERGEEEREAEAAAVKSWPRTARLAALYLTHGIIPLAIVVLPIVLHH
jgi:hypothetical protein